MWCDPALGTNVSPKLTDFLINKEYALESAISTEDAFNKRCGILIFRGGPEERGRVICSLVMTE